MLLFLIALLTDRAFFPVITKPLPFDPYLRVAAVNWSLPSRSLLRSARRLPLPLDEATCNQMQAFMVSLEEHPVVSTSTNAIVMACFLLLNDTWADGEKDHLFPSHLGYPLKPWLRKAADMGFADWTVSQDLTAYLYHPSTSLRALIDRLKMVAGLPLNEPYVAVHWRSGENGVDGIRLQASPTNLDDAVACIVNTSLTLQLPRSTRYFVAADAKQVFDRFMTAWTHRGLPAHAIFSIHNIGGVVSHVDRQQSDEDGVRFMLLDFFMMQGAQLLFGVRSGLSQAAAEANGLGLSIQFPGCAQHDLRHWGARLDRWSASLDSQPDPFSHP
jgi:hypothetical protein